MGLIQVALGSLASTLADTWKDYFVCDSLDNSVLMVRGVKKGGGLFDSKDVITNGSGIVVAEGQCALITDEGQVLEVANEAGGYTFDTTKSPSVFDGGFEGIKNTFSELVSRFTYGGEAHKNQRVYYVNTKEVTGNLFGTVTPIPFRVVDKNVGLDLDASIRCNGEYTFQVVNPLLFYKNVAGNVSDRFAKSSLEETMKSELLTALQPALAKISELGVRYSEVPTHTGELVSFLNEQLSEKWTALRGIKIVSFNINSLTLSKEDEERIKTLQTYKTPDMIAANLAAAQGQALKDAAKNTNGVAATMMGVNMVGSGVGETITAAMNSTKTAPVTPAGETWTCSCGSVNSAEANFCPKCGSAKPAVKYCPKCGKPVEADANFCPSCGQQL